MRKEELIFLGIIKEKIDPNNKNSEQYKELERREILKKVQKENQKNYR